jgi:hypothetical protein
MSEFGGTVNECTLDPAEKVTLVDNTNIVDKKQTCRQA